MHQRHRLRPLPVVLLLWQLHYQGLCFWTPQPRGSLTSEYLLFYVGENLTLHCHKNSPFDSEVTFKYGNVELDKQFITRVNNTYARLDKPVNSTDPSEAIYECSDSTRIGGNTIYIDYPPQNATHLEMVWLEKTPLQMKWRFGEDGITYKNTHPKIIRFQVHWRKELADGFRPWQLCDHNTSNTCNVSGFTDAGAVVSVRVSVHIVKRNEQLTSILPGLRVEDHAQPMAPRVSGVEAASSQSARVKVEVDWGELQYTITSCTMLGGADHCSQTETQPTAERALTVADLHPSYTYTFWVRARFDKGFYSSDSQPWELTMPEDAPTSAPNVTPGSFYLDRTACTHSPPVATAYIYFQEVAKEDQNGQIQNYTGEVTGGTGQVSVHSKGDEARTLKVSNMDCQGGFNMSLYASTHAGRSPPMLLSVPPLDQDLDSRVRRQDLRVRVEGENVTAEWNPDPDLANSTFLLYFCSRDGTDLDLCKEAVQYVQADPQASQAPLPARGDMMFGVAVLTPEGRTTGMVKTSCIYDPDPSKLGQVVWDVKAMGQTDHLLVSWQGPQRCDTNKRVIVLTYEVELCAQRQTSCQSYLVDGYENTVKVTRVKAGVTYRVRVRANTTSGLTAFSQSHTTTLLEQGGAELSGGAITGIALAVLTVCIILGAIIFCHCRARCRRMENMFTKNIKRSSFKYPSASSGMDNFGASIPPENHLQHDDKGAPPLVKQQVSDDSGYDQDSPPISPFSLTPGQGTEPSKDPLDGALIPSPAPPHGADSMDESSFTNLHLPSSGRPAQDGNRLDSPGQGEVSGVGPYGSGQGEVSGVGPYVCAARVGPSSQDSGTDVDDALALSHGHEVMVYHVHSDPPLLGPHNTPHVSPPLPFASPDRQSCQLLGRPAEGEKVAQDKGGGWGSGCRQEPEGVDTVGRVVGPVCQDELLKATVQPISKGISSYVTLTTADSGGADRGVDTPPAGGDKSDNEGSLDTDQEEQQLVSPSDAHLTPDPSCLQGREPGVALEHPLPASEGVALERPLLASEGVALERPLSPSEGVALERPLPASEGVALERPLPASEGVALERPLPASEGVAGERDVNREGGTRMEPAYVQWPWQPQAAHRNPAAASELTQAVGDAAQPPPLPERGGAELHPGYVSLTLQPVQPLPAPTCPGSQVEEKQDVGRGGPAGDHEDRENTCGPEGAIVPSDGYVPHSFLPGATSLLADPPPSPTLPGSEAEESSDEHSDSLDPEGWGEDRGGGCPTFTEDADNSGLTGSEDGEGGSSVAPCDITPTGCGGEKQTGSDGSSLLDKHQPTHKEQEPRGQKNAISNGYVPWRSLPFQTGSSEPSSNTGCSPKDVKDGLVLKRLDSGYRSPLAEEGFSDLWREPSSTHNYAFPSDSAA